MPYKKCDKHSYYYYTECLYCLADAKTDPFIDLFNEVGSTSEEIEKALEAYNKRIADSDMATLDRLAQNDPEEYNRRKHKIESSSRLYEPPKPEEKPYEYDPDFDDI